MGLSRSDYWILATLFSVLLAVALGVTLRERIIDTSIAITGIMQEAAVDEEPGGEFRWPWVSEASEKCADECRDEGYLGGKCAASCNENSQVSIGRGPCPSGTRCCCNKCTKDSQCQKPKCVNQWKCEGAKWSCVGGSCDRKSFDEECATKKCELYFTTDGKTRECIWGTCLKSGDCLEGTFGGTHRCEHV